MLFNIKSGESLTAVQVAAITTTSPKAKVVYSDGSGPATSMVALNGVTAVTLLSGPTNGVRTIVCLSIYNEDTVAQSVTLSHIQSGTTYNITKITLQAGETLVIDSHGMRVLDTNGGTKSSAVANVATVLPGPLTSIIGASTAAAGTTTADAGALPAGTANVYPTTAANGTKGVVISTSDKADGRTMLIGNGVSNQTLKVYPPSGGTINGAAADAAFVSASGKGVIVVCLSAAANTWLAW